MVITWDLRASEKVGGLAGVTLIATESLLRVLCAILNELKDSKVKTCSPSSNSVVSISTSVDVSCSVKVTKDCSERRFIASCVPMGSAE